jgi:hypothetical protein
MTDRELIDRLLFLAQTAVDQALDLNYDDPEDYFIYRELRGLKAAVAALAQPEPARQPTFAELLMPPPSAALAQPEPQGPSDAANRIAHYLEQRRLIRGLDPEVINALHAGTDEPRQAALTVSDLEALARYARPAIQPVVPTDEYWDALKERLWDQHQTIGYQGKRFMYYNDFSAAFDDARAVLARWGRSVIEPEPQGLTDAEIDDWHSQCADLTRVGEADHYWAFDFRHDEVAEVVRAA